MDKLMEKHCYKCSMTITDDEVALHKKLYNRAAESFLCIGCSSRYLGVTQELLVQKIQEFKNMGCTLFEHRL